MHRGTNRNCALCRVMRSMAFSGAGALIGALGAMLLFDASRQNILLSAVLMAAIFVFVFVEKKNDDQHQ